jgi:hypothetical protein
VSDCLSIGGATKRGKSTRQNPSSGYGVPRR